MENVAVHAGQPGAEAAPAQEPPKENAQNAQPSDGGAPTVSTPTKAEPGICTKVCDYVAENWKPMLVGAAAGAAITAGAVLAFGGSKEAPVVI